MTLTDPSILPEPSTGSRPRRIAVRSGVSVRSVAPRSGRRRRLVLFAAPESRVEAVLLTVAALVSVIAVGLRFVGPTGLWLDESITVSISHLPLPKLLEALRHDGSPPAYYVLLHFWMRVFGTGTDAVRALAGVISVATLPVGWRLGRAIGGRRVATALVVVLACNPFALRYGTENRMYSLVMLLSTIAALALVRSLQRPTVVRLVAFGTVCGLLLLTHYWALYLMAGIGGALAVASVWGPVRARARLCLAALCGGGLLFVPWVPSFLFQAAHTGTPWATPASPMMLVQTLGEFAGWQKHNGVALFVGYLTLLVAVAAGVGFLKWDRAAGLARAVGIRRRIPGARWAGPIAAVAVGTILLGMVGGMVAKAAFAYRYASVVMPLVALLLALGITAIGRTRAGVVASAAVLASVALLGSSAGATEIMDKRTQATEVAAQIVADARPGDVVAFCPDQLGPAVSRLLPTRAFTQVTFPRFDDPARINWVDYTQINAAASPGAFARALLNLAGSHQVWLVWETGYRTLGRSCEQLRDTLMVTRPDFTEPVHSQPGRYYEHESLVRFSAA
ncbi:MAG: hypothetical protein NVSMB4_06400 [Acidimicrobiales bacterium]